MLVNEFRSLIDQHVSLGKASSAGFRTCKCAICNDYKERGGFKFDGDSIIYSCFNCGFKAVFNNAESKRPSNKFIKLLVNFGIQEDIIRALTAKHIIASGSMDNPETREAIVKLEKWSPPKPINAPSDWVSIETDSSPWTLVAREYLKTRALSQADYKFFVSTNPTYEGRLIIPFWNKESLIYFQARALDDEFITPRYLNSIIDKDKIIFNYDELSNGAAVESLFVVEGALDAISIGKRAIAINGSTLSAWQLAELKKAARSGRKIIFIIDKNENGLNLGLKALAEGWYVTVLPDGIDDANFGRQQYGKLWLLNHISSTAVTDLAGRLLLAAKCAKKPYK